MPNDSIVSWFILTMLVYGAAFYIVAKGILEKEMYRRENNNLF